MEQVIVNLLNNAAKYTEKGGDIEVSVDQDADDVVLRVRDTGIGIAPEVLPQVFDLFTQAERSLDRSQGGLGIGLTVVRRLVELHRGTITANSAGLGKGAEFIVRLPVGHPLATSGSVPTIERAEHDGATWRVLVVDDNADSADLMALSLRQLGHEARAVYSAQDALQMATEYQPDFVLLDIGLPEIDGYQVAQRLRQQPELKAARLVAMTGYGQESDRERSREAGIDEHLVKPVDVEKLEQVLTMLATRGRPEQ